MEKKLIILIFILLCGFTIHAQLFVTDHEGNEYEYQKMADGRNWMLENIRLTTNIEGDTIHHYWRDNSNPEITLYGYDTKEAAAFAVGFAYLREEFLGSEGGSSVRTYTARTQGLCPDGWYVPELVSKSGASADYNDLIAAYGGTLSAYSSNPNWEPLKSAMRLAPAGYGFGKFQLDLETKEVLKYNAGQLHFMTSGHMGRTNNAILLNVSGWTLIWGGYEESADRPAYCRCVENIQSNVSFSNFSPFGVDISFTEALRPNYGFGEKVEIGDEEIDVSDICDRNFIIKEYETGNIVTVDEVFKSEDYKTIQISANLDESKIYELIIVDSKLTDKPFGGYTFNGGMKMYFPTDPTGVNLIKDLEVKINVTKNVLYVEQFGANLDAVIFDVKGSKQMSVNNLNGMEMINISNLHRGIYLLQLIDPATRNYTTRKFVIK